MAGGAESREAQRGRRLRGLVLALTVLGSLGMASQASATTFCVPNFHAACGNEGGHVAAAMQTALETGRNDGQPDQIILAAGRLDDPSSGVGGTFTIASGADALTITGAGSDATTLTNAATGNVIALNLFSGISSPAALQLEGFTFEVPDTMATDLGLAMQLPPGAELDDVDIRNTHDNADGIAFVGMDGSFRDGAIYSEGTGVDVDRGIFGQNLSGAGTIDVSNARIEANTPLDGSNLDLTKPTGDFDVDRAYVSGLLAAIFAPGVDVTATNSVFELRPRADNAGNTSAVVLQATASGLEPGSTFTGDHLTFAGPPSSNTGTTYVGLSAAVPVGAAGSVSATVTNSIFRNPDAEIERIAPAMSADGDATVSLGYSGIDLADVASTGDGEITDLGNNIDADPLLTGAGDYHLAEGSPAIDAGDPGALLPDIDIEGITRPLDGDLDGAAVRDMGAYEFAPADNQVGIAILGKSATLTRTGHLQASLRCPPGEASGPCAGRLKLATARKVRVGNKRRKVTFGTKQFMVQSGQAKKVTITPSSRNVKLLRDSEPARKLRATARVSDQAGNDATVSKRLGVRVK